MLWQMTPAAFVAARASTAAPACRTREGQLLCPKSDEGWIDGSNPVSAYCAASWYKGGALWLSLFGLTAIFRLRTMPMLERKLCEKESVNVDAAWGNKLSRGSLVQTKLMVILANSRRKGGRCIAAKEVELGCGYITPGGWVRPVAPAGPSEEGELGPAHCLTSAGRSIQVLDIARGHFEGPTKGLNQPENWRLARQSAWELVDACPAQCLEDLTDHPSGLWDEPDSRDNFRRISVEAPASAFGGFSLALIRPKDFSIVCLRRHNPWRGRTTQENTGRFEYSGRTYACRITDDAFEAQYCQMSRDGIREFPSPFGDDCLLCMSLSAPFMGHHYKLIASVIPLHRQSEQCEVPEADIPF